METVLIYFLMNFYITGAIDARTREERNSWWLTPLLLCTASFILLAPVGEFIDKKLSPFDWYQRLKFWIQLNLLGTFSRYTEDHVYSIEKFISNSEGKYASRVKKQWKRVKLKYNY